MTAISTGAGLGALLLDMLGPEPSPDHRGVAEGAIEPRMLIDGRLVTTEKRFDNISPATGTVLGSVYDAGAAEMDAAIAAARRAFVHSGWRDDPQLRTRSLLQLADAMERHREQLRWAVMAELGAPVRLTVSVHVDRVIEKVREAAAYATAVPGAVRLPDEEVPGSRSERWLHRIPVGVVGAITPWNIPLDIPMAKMVGALAAGNSFVLKPAPDTPLAINLVGRLIVEETDIPAGIVNIVPSSDHLLGKQLVDDPDVDFVSFTGSTGTGKAVMVGAAATLKRVHLELGGKSPNVVLDDVDLAAVIPFAAAAACFNAGQSCILPSRLLVPQANYKECVELAADGIAAVSVGDPADVTTFMGPLVSAAHRGRVHSMVVDGLAQGGRLVTGGQLPQGPGNFYPPTLIADVEENHPLVQQEIFGPVLVVQPYRDDNDAVRVANGTEFGLAGYVWSADIERANAVASNIEAGMVGINGGNFTGADMPFGGVKSSGFGREWGVGGVHEFTDLKTFARGSTPGSAPVAEAAGSR